MCNQIVLFTLLLYCCCELLLFLLIINTTILVKCIYCICYVNVLGFQESFVYILYKYLCGTNSIAH